MKKLLLLDADVVIDLNTFNLFEKISKAYDVQVTETVLKEAKYYPKGNQRIPINIEQKVTVIEDVDINFLGKVSSEAREAMLTVDPGEATSIAYLLQNEDDMSFCTCDHAAIKLVSYMELENKSVSLETALRIASQHKKLYPRHLDKTFKKCISEGKALRIQHKI